jgi:hypothetical protein
LPLPWLLSSNAIVFPLLIACGRFRLSRNPMEMTACSAQSLQHLPATDLPAHLQSSTLQQVEA